MHDRWTTTGPVDRRSFLQLSLLGASALTMSSYSSRARAASQTGECAYLAGRHRLPDQPQGSRNSRVALLSSIDFPSHREAIRAVIELAGGLDFIQPGQTVLLKPAVNSSNAYPATTDPETVWAVAEMVKEVGGEPFVADRTMFLRSTDESFRETGIHDAAAQAQIPCRPLDDEAAISVHHPLAENWGGNSIRIYAPVLEADHIINLCTPRTHVLGDFTMAMKNNVGIVNTRSRLSMHIPWGLKERLAEIPLVVRASLIVMDGRQGFADKGPDSGPLVNTGFMAAGTDPVAIDAVGLAQLRLQGANETISEQSIWNLSMMKRAAEIGLGAASSADITLVGIDPAGETALRAQMA
jgi:uncharacterized protein (DUF362 family)